MSDISQAEGSVPQPTWKDQYERMQRSYRRFQMLKRRIIKRETGHLHSHGPTASSPISKKALATWEASFWHFLSDCYHLKDWLINDTSIKPPIFSEELHSLIDNSEDLSLIGDLVTGHKHLEMKQRRPRHTGKKPLMRVRQVHGFSVVYDRDSEAQEISWAFRLHVIDLDEGYSKSEANLLRNALDFWREFLASKQLL